MTPSVPSPFSWPVLAGIAGNFLPLAFALIARRPLLRAPVGRIALGWAIMGLLDLATLAQYLKVFSFGFRVGMLSAPLAAILFAPPLLSWIVSRPMRRTPIVALVVVGLTSLGMALLGTGREFALFAVPVSNLMLATLGVLALARQIWRSAEPPMRTDWFWVLAGMIVYYGVGILWRPLSEYLVARDWAAVVDLHMGMMLVHVLAYLLMARGAAMRPARADDPASFTAIPRPA